jgi:WD40 repeat protein
LDCGYGDGNGYAFATGGGAVYQCRAFNELEVEQKYTSFPTGLDKWSFVRYSWRSQHDTLLVAASSETGRLWLPDRDLKQDAHQAAITSLQIRPQQLDGQTALSTSEFATSSEDGTLKVWRYDRGRESLTTLAKLSLGVPQLLKTLAYSPDGFCLAGASYGIVRIWNAEHGYNQMANWEGHGSVWTGNSLKDDDLVSNGTMSSVNGEGFAMGADHSLTWHTDSKKLAFALGSQVCYKLSVMAQLLTGRGRTHQLPEMRTYPSLVLSQPCLMT